MSGSSEGYRLRFRVRGWMAREDFESVLRFSRYLGRDEEGSIFEVDPAKAERNGLGLDDVVEVLERLGVEGDAIERVKRWFEERSYDVELLLEGDSILLRPLLYLGDRLSDFRDLLRYDKGRKCFVVPPGMLWKVVRELERQGLAVRDRTGLPASVPLGIPVTFKGKLRDYQEEALEAWKRNSFRGVIALPTGAGKTVIAVKAIADLGLRTLVVVYTKEQLHQWIEKLRELTDIPGAAVAAFYSEEKRLGPVTVTTYQTAHRHVRDLAFRFSFLIVDEVHHLPAEKFKTIALGVYAPYRMGLSATVVREDGKHVELFPLMGGVVYYKSPDELAEKGYIARYVVRIVRVELKPEEKAKFEELRKLYKALAQGVPFQELVKRALAGDLTAARALKVHSDMLKLVHMSKAKEEAVKRIVAEELGKGSKILVFAQYVDQAEELGRLLGAPVLTGETETKERRRALEEFRRCERGVLVLTTVGDEGLDVPDANVGIIVAGTGSRRQYVQRLGRLLRPGPGKIARLYEIVTKGTGEEAMARRRKTLGLDFFDSATA